MQGRENGTGAGGFEFAAGLSSRGQMFVGEEKGVKAARGLLNESLDGGAASGAPGFVGRGVVPVGDEEIRRAAKEDAEIGVGIEKPLACERGVRDTCLVGPKAGLEMLGAVFERENVDAKREPPTGAEVARTGTQAA